MANRHRWRISDKHLRWLDTEKTAAAVISSDANGKNSLWVRALDKLDATNLPGTDAFFPFWSPDGSALAYYQSCNPQPKRLRAAHARSDGPRSCLGVRFRHPRQLQLHIDSS
jgi:hypothetical protein